MTRRHLQREWNLVLMLVHQRVAYAFKVSDLPQLFSILETVPNLTTRRFCDASCGRASRTSSTGGVRIRLGSFECVCFYLNARILTMVLKLQVIKWLLQSTLVGVVRTGLNECGNLLPSKDVTRIQLTAHYDNVLERNISLSFEAHIMHSP